MKRATVVVIDHEADSLEAIRGALDEFEFDVRAYSSPHVALQNMEKHGADVLLADLKTQEMHGLKLAEAVRGRWPDCKVVIFTGYGAIEEAVREIKSGAVDFLTKPVNKQAIPEMVREMVSLQPSEDAPARKEMIEPAAGATPSFTDLAHASAPTDCTILITGETGTGKEVLADYVWSHSARKNQPFVKVNCAALSESLIESELFGHERGAFTGANKQHTGRFERANHGTLFLDEIGELPLNIQTKLLRVLQTQEIERVGGTSLVKIDFRLICATHRDLAKMVAEGKFRQDLYYRISSFPIHVPALRERPSEIARLARGFLKRYREILQRGPLTIAPDAQRILETYSWPGNVRELEHCLERACLLARSPELRAADLWWLSTPSMSNVAAQAVSMPAVAAPAQDGSVSPLEMAEKTTLQDTLQKFKWNYTQAAQALGICRSTLYLKAHKHAIVRPDKRVC